MKTNFSRREFLAAASLAAGAMAAPGVASVLKTQATRVAIGQCAEYNRQVTDVLSAMFNQLGGNGLKIGQPHIDHQRRIGWKRAFPFGC